MLIWSMDVGKDGDKGVGMDCGKDVSEDGGKDGNKDEDNKLGPGPGPIY